MTVNYFLGYINVKGADALLRDETIQLTSENLLDIKYSLKEEIDRAKGKSDFLLVELDRVNKEIELRNSPEFALEKILKDIKSIKDDDVLKISGIKIK